MTERRINPLYASAEKIIELMSGQPIRSRDQEYGVSPHQNARMGRYVQRLVLMRGDLADTELAEATALAASNNMKEDGLLDPNVALGIFPILISREDQNKRLLQTDVAMHEAVRDHGVVPVDISARAHVVLGNNESRFVRGSDSVRAYNAIDGVIRSFEYELGYKPDDPPKPEDVALVGIVQAAWASGAFKGIRQEDFMDGNLPVLRDVGDRTSDYRWSRSLFGSLVIPSHD